MSRPLELGAEVVVSLEQRDGRRWWLVQEGDENGARHHREAVALEDVEFRLSPARVARRMTDPSYEGAIGFAHGRLSDHGGRDCGRRVRFSQPPPPAPIDLDDPPRFMVDGETIRESPVFYGDPACRGWVR